MITDNLITDRNLPGRYDWRDFNRVQTAVQQLNDLLRANGYQSYVTPMPTWDRTMIPTAKQLNDYVDNVKRLRIMLDISGQMPDTLRKLTYGGANQIEQILVDIEDAINHIKNASFFAGDLYAGEV